jgi:hypothetical protein
MSEFSHLKKNECIDLLKKIMKRVSKEEKPKKYRGQPSPSYCGKGSTPRGRIKGDGSMCIRKGVGVGKAMGKLEGVNTEREAIQKIITRYLS